MEDDLLPRDVAEAYLKENTSMSEEQIQRYLHKTQYFPINHLKNAIKFFPKPNKKFVSPCPTPTPAEIEILAIIAEEC